MFYCTADDMIKRFGEQELIQLTSKGQSNAIDNEVLYLAIADGSAEIDGYLAGFQLTTVPKTLVRVSCDIARYFLYDDIIPEPVEKRYDAVIRFLEQIAKGNISLGTDDSGNTPESDNTATMQSGGRVFGRHDNGFL